MYERVPFYCEQAGKKVTIIYCLELKNKRYVRVGENRCEREFPPISCNRCKPLNKVKIKLEVRRHYIENFVFYPPAENEPVEASAFFEKRAGVAESI